MAKRYLFLFLFPFVTCLQVVTAGADDFAYVGPIAGAPRGDKFQEVGDRLYYTDRKKQLWVTDGTKGNTTRVNMYFEPDAAIAQVYNMTSFKGDLFVNAQYFDEDGSTACDFGCRGLFKLETDTGQFSLVREKLFIGSIENENKGTTALNAGSSLIYFFAKETHDDGNENGWNATLWRSDGTRQGTYQIQVENNSRYGSRVVIGNRFYFGNRNGSPISGGLWASDGSVQGTKVIDYRGFEHLASIDQKLIYIAYQRDPQGGYFYIASSDGTAAGSRSVHKFSPYAAIAESPNHSTFVSSGRSLYFKILPSTLRTTTELWRTDGQIAAKVGYEINADHLTDLQGTLYYTKKTSNFGQELWRLHNGTPRIVEDIRPGLGSSEVGNLIAVNNTLFFTADDGNHGLEIWTANNSTSGSKLFKDIYPGLNSSLPTLYISVLGKLFFGAFTGDFWHSVPLWVASGEPIEAPPVEVAPPPQEDAPPEDVAPPPSDKAPVGLKMFYPREGEVVQGDFFISGAAEPGAVVVVSVGSESTFQFTTDDRGLWYGWVRDISDGTHTVKVSDANKKEQQPLTRTVTVKSPPDIRENQIKLVVSGQVTVNGIPKAGIGVSIQGICYVKDDYKMSENTDKNGRYEVVCTRDITENHYEVCARARGYNVNQCETRDIDKTKAGMQHVVSDMNFSVMTNIGKLEEALTDTSDLFKSISSPVEEGMKEETVLRLQEQVEQIKIATSPREIEWRLSRKSKRFMARLERLVKKVDKNQKNNRRTERLLKRTQRVFSRLYRSLSATYQLSQ